MSCAFCGRENEAESRFCIDCGKPVYPSVARVGPANLSTACPRCGKTTAADLPFCGHCGTRIVAAAEESTCGKCGASYTIGVDLFCSRCGTDLKQRVTTAGDASAGTQDDTSPGPRLSLIGEAREIIETYALQRGDAVIGRADADIVFADDHFLSPLHTRLDLRSGRLWARDLGSRNGTWIFIDEPTQLADCDLMLIGSQLIRFRRLGYPGPHPPEADATRRMGSSTPTADVAVLEQLRSDGSVRDMLHLSPGRSVTIGREVGDWIFPYDSTMSRRHAEVRSEGSEFFVHDARSRNGVAMAVHGERALNPGQRLLVGNQILRLESV